MTKTPQGQRPKREGKRTEGARSLISGKSIQVEEAFDGKIGGSGFTYSFAFYKLSAPFADRGPVEEEPYLVNAGHIPVPDPGQAALDGGLLRICGTGILVCGRPCKLQSQVAETLQRRRFRIPCLTAEV